MSKIEYLSLEGLRIDGRRIHEVRNVEILCGSECGVNVINYDGVSQVTQGLTKVQTFVKGPVEVVKTKQRSSYDDNDGTVDIQCEVVMPCEKRVASLKNDRQTADLALAVITTFERIIVSHLYRNSSIHIFVNVLETDGGIKSTVLNSVAVALVDAGIAMKDLVASCTSVMLKSELFIDPNQQEANAAILELTLAVSVSNDEIIYIDLKSEHAIKSVSDIIHASIIASKQFSQIANTKLKGYAEDVLELNKLLHI